MKEITFAEAVREALGEEMAKDPNMIILGEDCGWRGGAFTCTIGLADQFPGRVFDTPISELAIAGAAYGAALTGSKTCAEIMFMDFSFLAMDQIINSAAKSRYMFGGQTTIPVVYRMPQGSGTQQAAQHTQSLEVIYAHIPGLKVVVPSNPYDAKGLMKSALNDENPVIFIEHKILYFRKGMIPEGDYTVPIGKGKIVREGRDVTVVATQIMVSKAMEAAQRLAAQGIDVEIIDPRTIKPLDEEMILESVRKTNRLVVAHEACKSYGIAGEIIALTCEKAFDYLDGPPVRVAGHDVPMPYNINLERRAVPQEEDIEKAILTMFGK